MACRLLNLTIWTELTPDLFVTYYMTKQCFIVQDITKNMVALFDNMGYIAPVIGVVVIFVVIMVVRKFMAGTSSAAERGAISKNPALSKAISSLKGAEKKVKEEEKESEQEESEAAEGAKEEKEEEGTTEEAETVFEEAAEERSEAEAEESLEKTEERTGGEIAFLNTINSLIKNYVHREEEESEKEERDEEHMNSLLKSLEGQINFQKIDSVAAPAIQTFEAKFQVDLGKEMELKEQKQEELKKLLHELKKTVKGLHGTVGAAKKNEAVFEKRDKVEVKTFKAKFKEVRTTIKDKYKKITKEMSNFKGADQSMIANLRQEVGILKENSERLKTFEVKLSESYKMLNKQIKQLNNLQKSIGKKEKLLEKTVKGLEKTESSVKKTSEKIKETYEAFKQNAAKQEGYQARMLEISNNINKFSKANEKLTLVTPKIQTGLKKTVTFVGDLTQTVRAYISIIGTIEQTEETLSEAGSNVGKLLEGILSTPSEKVPEEAIEKTEMALAEQEKVAQKVAEELARFTEQMEFELKNTYAEMDKLPMQDQQILTMLRGVSQKLGSFAAAILGQKVAIDKEFLEKSDQFAKQLDQRNAAAASSFNQAKKAVPS